MRSLTLTSVLTGILLLGAGVAHAKDLCVYKLNGAQLLTVRGIRIPKPGTCKSMVGTASNAALHGTLCRNSTGQVLRLAAAVAAQPALFMGGSLKHIAIGLDYPFADGSGMEYVVADGGASGISEGFNSLNGLTAAYCTGGPIL